MIGNVAAVKIKSVKVVQTGIRGAKITLPVAWTDDQDVIGDLLIGAWSDEDNNLFLSLDEGQRYPGLSKISTYKVSHGKRYLNVTLPKPWRDNAGIVLGDRLNIYRDELDRLIIVKEAS